MTSAAAGEEALGELGFAFEERVGEGAAFEGGDGHALSVNRIEAAEGIAHGEQAFGEDWKLFETAAEAVREAGGAGFIERLGLRDHVVDVGNAE